MNHQKVLLFKNNRELISDAEIDGIIIKIKAQGILSEISILKIGKHVILEFFVKYFAEYLDTESFKEKYSAVAIFSPDEMGEVDYLAIFASDIYNFKTKNFANNFVVYDFDEIRISGESLSVKNFLNETIFRLKNFTGDKSKYFDYNLEPSGGILQLNTCNESISNEDNSYLENIKREMISEDSFTKLISCYTTGITPAGNREGGGSLYKRFLSKLGESPNSKIYENIEAITFYKNSREIIKITWDKKYKKWKYERSRYLWDAIINREYLELVNWYNLIEI